MLEVIRTCDVCGSRPSEHVALAIASRRWSVDLCGAHQTELLSMPWRERKGVSGEDVTPRERHYAKLRTFVRMPPSI